jgi:hypothetical protein
MNHGHLIQSGTAYQTVPTLVYLGLHCYVGYSTKSEHIMGQEPLTVAVTNQYITKQKKAGKKKLKN